MKKCSAARLVIVYFVRTIGIIMLLLGVGVLSYYLTKVFLEKTARVERSSQYEHVIDINTGKESSNLIYSFDEKSKEIKAMVLELFDCNTKNMTYITIPANTQITLSSNTYRELLEKSNKIPQVVTLSDVNKYFDGDVAFEYGIKILQEELKADIGYFTAMKSSEFDKLFTCEQENKALYCPSKSLLDEAEQNKEEDLMADFIESKWDNLISDIGLSQKQHYARDLIGVNRNLIRCYRVYGKSVNGVFELNRAKNRRLIRKIWESEAYTYAQNRKKDSTEGANSNTTVFIYNGSRITGLAARYQQKLEADGYTVKGVGNATGNIRERTTIYAKKNKKAKKISKYFKDPKLEHTTSMSSGADVEIVLGTRDDLNG